MLYADKQSASKQMVKVTASVHGPFAPAGRGGHARVDPGRYFRRDNTGFVLMSPAVGKQGVMGATGLYEAFQVLARWARSTCKPCKCPATCHPSKPPARLQARRGLLRSAGAVLPVRWWLDG